jgi:hypothetical protein
VVAVHRLALLAHHWLGARIPPATVAKVVVFSISETIAISVEKPYFSAGSLMYQQPPADLMI